MKKLIGLILVTCIIVSGCGSGITQEEYDAVLEERDAQKETLEKYILENEKPAIEYFSYNDNISISESTGESEKTLNITYYLKKYEDEDKIEKTFSELGEKIKSAQSEDWFIYDYVFLDIWSDSLGKIGSITIDPYDMSAPLQYYDWYGNENQNNQSKAGGSKDQPEGKEGKKIYEDDNVIITYTGISGEENEYSFNYIIENLTEKTLTVQTEETSINGFMVDPICSIDIAPGKKANDGMKIWSEDAENHPMSSVENAETKFYIYKGDDLSDSYETESVVIIE